MNKEELIRMAHEAGFHKWYSDPERVYHFGCIENFAALVAAHEREACAQICAEQEDDDYYTGNQYAQAIRARSQE
jgi:hypothetical protein